jgi:hypothetical protein
MTLSKLYEWKMWMIIKEKKKQNELMNNKLASFTIISCLFYYAILLLIISISSKLKNKLNALKLYSFKNKRVIIII